MDKWTELFVWHEKMCGHFMRISTANKMHFGWKIGELAGRRIGGVTRGFGG